MKSAKKRVSLDKKADTRPTKSFLVEDVTKDIKIDDAIADLIDNAIDSFSGNDAEPRSDYTGCKIELIISSKKFSIIDNGFGIASSKLEKSALRFGSKSKNSFGIGTFGVGLNRAIFKIGKKITITTETELERCNISIDATEYQNDNDNWDIPFDVVAKTGKLGTTIEISHLLASVDLGDSSFVDGLIEKAKTLYSRFIELGLTITINNQVVPLLSLDFRDESDFTKLSSEFEKDGVAVKVELGQHKDHYFSYEGKNHARREEFGWYIYCNNRAILVADWSDLVGWEATDHSQYYGFIGIATFDGEAAKLPWNTSKSAPDLNNPIYREAIKKIRDQSQKWRSHTDRVKKGGFSKPSNSPPKPTHQPTPPKSGGKGSIPSPDHPFADHNYLLGGKNRAKTSLGFAIPSDQVKLCSAFNEIIRLNLNEFPLAATMLLRVIVELSCTFYKSKHSLKYKKETPLKEAVSIIATNMQSKGFLEPQEEKVVKSVCGQMGQKIISIDYLQSILHQPKSHSFSKDAILAFWNDIVPFIKACLTR